jgi:hypothetical protein
MKMNKKLVLLTVIIAIAGVSSAQNKKVAVMETKNIAGVTSMECTMIRGSMESAVVNSSEYEGYSRTDFDFIIQEHQFERSGTVDDSQIRELGKMAGVQYILVTEAGKQAGFFYILAKILDVETGQFMKSVNDLCDAIPTDIKETCDYIGMQLLGGDGSMKTRKNLPKKPLPTYNESGEPLAREPVAVFYFDNNSNLREPADINPRTINIIHGIIERYSIQGFEVVGYIAPDESDSIGRAETVLELIKTEIKRAGLDEKDYRFFAKDYDFDVSTLIEEISYLHIKDRDQIIRVIENSSNPKAEINLLSKIYIEIGRDIFPLFRRVEVYVY